MRKLFFIIIMLCGVALTGCASLVDMDEQQSDMVAEYMAGTVLRHTENYDEALIYPESAQESQEADGNTDEIIPVSESGTVTNETASLPDETASQAENTKDNIAASTDEEGIDDDGLEAVDFSDFAKLLGEDKFNITYSKYGFYDSFSDEDNYFTIVPSKGKKLIIITFNVKNVTNKTQVFDLSQSQILYELQSKDGKVYKPMMTLLLEDIQYINLKIGAKKSQKAVIVFDVLKDIDKADMKLKISYEGETTTVDLK